MIFTSYLSSYCCSSCHLTFTLSLACFLSTTFSISYILYLPFLINLLLIRRDNPSKFSYHFTYDRLFLRYSLPLYFPSYYRYFSSSTHMQNFPFSHPHHPLPNRPVTVPHLFIFCGDERKENWAWEDDRRLGECDRQTDSAHLKPISEDTFIYHTSHFLCTHHLW